MLTVLIAGHGALGWGADAAPPPTAQHFDVHEYRVLGNTVLSNRQIEGVLYPLLGDGKTIEDVQAARGALENAYHALGFATVFVDVPPQEVADGIVRLKVMEGRVRVRSISGARYFSEGRILDQLPETRPGTVPNLQVLQQQLNAVNNTTPDRAVVPVLKAGPDPGTMDLALKVDDHLPLHATVDLNNQYTPDTDSLRATFALSYDNLFAELDSIAAMYTLTPQSTGQVKVFNATYGFRPVGPGIRASLSFTDSKSNVSTIGTLGVLGDGQVTGMRMNFPLAQFPGELQSLTLGIDYKHFRNTIALDSSAADGGKLVEPISYVNASLTYAGAWQHFSKDGVLQQSYAFDIAADGGPRGLANETENFNGTHFQARGNYAYFHSDLSFTTRLPGALQLTLKGSGQAAQDPLVVYEEDAVTGANAVRGYLEAEVLADTAVLGTIQLTSPPLSARKFLLGDAFLFYDAGRAHTVQPLAGEPDHTLLRSWGAGLDLFTGHSISGVLTIADPLLPGPRTKAHEPRVLFDVKGTF